MQLGQLVPSIRALNVIPKNTRRIGYVMHASGNHNIVVDIVCWVVTGVVKFASLNNDGCISI